MAGKAFLIPAKLKNTRSFRNRRYRCANSANHPASLHIRQDLIARTTGKPPHAEGLTNWTGRASEAERTRPPMRDGAQGSSFLCCYFHRIFYALPTF